MCKKENVNQVKKGYAMLFTSDCEFISSKVLKIYFWEEKPSAFDVICLIEVVYDELECGIDIPVSVSDLYCHVFDAIEVDSCLKIFGDPLNVYGGFDSNVL